MKNDFIFPKGNNENWHSLRKKTIGASEIGILFGESPYSTKNDLYHNKIQDSYIDEDSPAKMGGRYMEPVIAKLVTNEKNWELEQCENYHVHPDYPFLGATLDYYIREKEFNVGLLEIKHVGSYASKQWRDNEAPLHIELQIQHQFLVTNAAREAEGLEPFKWGAIASLHGGNFEDLRIFIRHPDIDLHKEIIKQAKEFWAQVQNRQPPPLMQSYKELEHILKVYLNSLNPETDDHNIIKYLNKNDDAELNQIIELYQEKNQLCKDLNKEVQALKAQIINSFLVQDGNNIINYNVMETKDYEASTKIVTVNRKPQPASTTKQIRFTVKNKRKNNL